MGPGRQFLSKQAGRSRRACGPRAAPPAPHRARLGSRLTTPQLGPGALDCISTVQMSRVPVLVVAIKRSVPVPVDGCASVGDLLDSLRHMLQTDLSSRDLADLRLFAPFEPGRRPAASVLPTGVWLDASQPVSQASMAPLLYALNTEIVALICTEGAMRTKVVVLDTAKPLSAMFDWVCPKLFIATPREYGMAVSVPGGPRRWLDLTLPLRAQLELGPSSKADPVTIDLHRRLFLTHRNALLEAAGAAKAYAQCLHAIGEGRLLLDRRTKTALIAVRALILQGPVNALDHDLNYLPNTPIDDVSDDAVLQIINTALLDATTQALHARFASLCFDTPLGEASLFRARLLASGDAAGARGAAVWLAIAPAGCTLVDMRGPADDSLATTGLDAPREAFAFADIRCWQCEPALARLCLFVGGQAEPLVLQLGTLPELAAASFALRVYAAPVGVHAAGEVAATPQAQLLDARPVPCVAFNAASLCKPLPRVFGTLAPADAPAAAASAAVRVAAATAAGGHTPYLALRLWLVLVSCAALFATAMGYCDVESVRSKQFANAPDQVSPLAARLWAVWTLLAAVVRLATAAAPGDRALFVACWLSFAVAFGFYATELLVFASLPARNVVGPAVASTVSLVWMGAIALQGTWPSSKARSQRPRALRIWIAFVAAAALFATVLGYTRIESVRDKQFSLVPDQVSPLAGRLWAVWTLLAALVRLATAADSSQPALYLVCAASFAIAFVFYATELLVYSTVPPANVTGPAIASTVSLGWMLLAR